MRWLGRAPGTASRADGPPPTAEQGRLRRELEADVHELAGRIGERNLSRTDALDAAARFIERSLGEAGHARIDRQRYEADGHPCDNLAVEIPGTDRADEIVVVGAHYDSAFGSPGANDNGTGVAAVLAFARRWAARAPGRRTLRLVAFTNEEVPHTHEESMGSLRYARRCRRQQERIVAMLALETMGYYSNAPHSQSYPLPMTPLYPNRGSFIGFVGNLGSLPLVRRSAAAFRRHSDFPCRSAILPGWVPGVAWSDHASFWSQGYPGIMVTDTAPFRYPHYHRPSDTPDKVDYPRLARVVEGLMGVVDDAVG
ncbi:MAG: M28 family peptidase [Myxococcota bacterium]